jgi:putative membrane protein
MKYGLIVFAALVLFSCNNAGRDSNVTAEEAAGTDDTATGRTATDTSGRSTGATATISSEPFGRDDSSFVVKAASGGLMEVQLGNIAQEKAVGSRVQAFGRMMVDDHSAANGELKGLAGNKGLMLSDSLGKKHKDHVENMQKKSGQAFDKAYMSMMVDDHRKDIKEFEKAAADSKDRDLKAFAEKTLPVLRKHLDSALAITGKKP